MPRRKLTILACLALALGGAFVAGCGSDKKDSASSAQTAPTTTPATTTSGDTGGTSPSTSTAIEMMSSKFVPASIKVKVGQKITWTNKDGYAHNVTSDAGEKIDSGNIEGGKTFEFTPTKAGTIAYECTLHSNQSGTITVTK